MVNLFAASSSLIHWWAAILVAFDRTGVVRIGGVSLDALRKTGAKPGVSGMAGSLHLDSLIVIWATGAVRPLLRAPVMRWLR